MPQADENNVSEMVADARMVAALKMDLVMNVFMPDGRHGAFRRLDLRPGEFRTQVCARRPRKGRERRLYVLCDPMAHHLRASLA